MHSTFTPRISHCIKRTFVSQCGRYRTGCVLTLTGRELPTRPNVMACFTVVQLRGLSEPDKKIITRSMFMEGAHTKVGQNAWFMEGASTKVGHIMHGS